MSSRTIGAEFEKKVKAALEERGFIVERAWAQFCPLGPGRVISKHHDFFGCADLIAYQPHDQGKLDSGLQRFWQPTWFIQCTAGGDRWAKMKKLQDHHWASSHRVQLWARDERDKQMVHVHELNFRDQGPWATRHFRWPEGVPNEVL